MGLGLDWKRYASAVRNVYNTRGSANTVYLVLYSGAREDTLGAGVPIHLGK